MCSYLCTVVRPHNCTTQGKRKQKLNACLLNYSESLLPGVCAGAEAMGRPWDTVIALYMVNISHVTMAVLLNSLILNVRPQAVRALSKQLLWRYSSYILTLKPYQTRQCTAAADRPFENICRTATCVYINMQETAAGRNISLWPFTINWCWWHF